MSPDKPPDNIFRYKDRHASLFSKEENVTWRISHDLKTITVRRVSWLYTTDNSTRLIALQYDDLHDVRAAIYVDGVQKFWKFIYTANHLVFFAEQRIMGSFIVDVNGTLNYDPYGLYQVGLIVEEDSESREYFAYATLYPCSAVNLMPGVSHNRQTFINLELHMDNHIYTAFTPNAPLRTGLHYPLMLMDNMGFVILRKFNVYMPTRKVRLIVHRISKKNGIQLPMQSFINTTQLVVRRIQSLFNMTISDMITIVFLPSVKERPMAFFRDYCLIDFSLVAVPEIEKMKLLMQCFIQQNIMRLYTTNDPWTQRTFFGMRDYMAHIFKSIRDLDSFDVMDLFDEEALKFHEDQAMDLKTKHSLLPDKHNFKVVAFFELLRAMSYNNSLIDYKSLLWNFFDPYKIRLKPGIEVLNDTRHATLKFLVAKPNSIIEYFNVVDLFADAYYLITNRTNETRDFPIDVFLNGWLRERGFPQLRTNLTRNNITGDRTLHYAGNMTACRLCSLLFPISLTIHTKVWLEPINKDDNSSSTPRRFKRETIEDTFWMITQRIGEWKTRIYKDVGYINRTSTYYYMNMLGSQLFRVFYDDENWKELLRHFTELPVLVRVRLISDIQYFHGLGRLSWKLIWVAIRRLEYELSPRVWIAGEKLVLDLERRFRDTDIEHDFHVLMINATKRFYNSTELRNPLATKLSCFFGDPLCLREATNRTKEWIDGNAVLFDRIEDVLCAGVRDIDNLYFDYLLKLVPQKTYRHRYIILIALTCYQHYDQLYGLLRQAFSMNTMEIPVKVKIMVLANMFMASKLGNQVVLRFMHHNYNIIRNYLTPDQIEELMLTFAPYIKNKYDYRVIWAIMRLTDANPVNVLKLIEDQMKWVKKSDVKLRQTFKKKRKLKRMIF